MTAVTISLVPTWKMFTLVNLPVVFHTVPFHNYPGLNKPLHFPHSLSINSLSYTISISLAITYERLLISQPKISVLGHYFVFVNFFFFFLHFLGM